MKQILLITDGCSNIGEDPVIAAAQALTEDIVVNVIGVIDQGDIGKRGAEEIQQIAAAGGGMSRIVSPQLLTRTVQMMTRQTVTQSIHSIVQKELKELTGHDDIEALPLQTRAHIVQVIDELSETSSLQVALLVDTSASMKPKLGAVEAAIRDLLLSLQSRIGASELAVFHFPSPAAGEAAEMKMDWTADLAKASKLFSKLKVRGTTPTGPALLQVIDFIVQRRSFAEIDCTEEEGLRQMG